MIKAKISSKGQISIPKAVRQQLGLAEGTEVEVSVQEQTVLLRKVVPRWQRWYGALSGTDILREHQREHREEVEAEEGSSQDA